uniref:Uncharacterized protein n=1 Tax=Arundo donax TaxID=35708 RepID=A0A0A8YV41_ARUDO
MHDPGTVDQCQTKRQYVYDEQDWHQATSLIRDMQASKSSDSLI